MATKKVVSGENIPEGHRNTDAIKLRLPPEAAELLREKASDQEMGLSEYIAKLLLTMRDNPEVPCGVLLEDLKGPFS